MRSLVIALCLVTTIAVFPGVCRARTRSNFSSGNTLAASSQGIRDLLKKRVQNPASNPQGLRPMRGEQNGATDSFSKPARLGIRDLLRR